VDWSRVRYVFVAVLNKTEANFPNNMVEFVGRAEILNRGRIENALEI
jgi:hypothetical protein